MTIAEAVKKIREAYPDAIGTQKEFRGEISLIVQADKFRAVCAFARDHVGFDYLLDITSVDHFGEEPRFEVVYELYSLKDGIHLRLKYPISEENDAPTVSDIWATANWHEREIYDMMGIKFKDHPDLRRILMWEGYPYFPLRKDFPLEGKPSQTAEAFTDIAPLDGGPFVTVPTDGTTQVREPRARHAGDPLPQKKFIAEP